MTPSAEASLISMPSVTAKGIIAIDLGELHEQNGTRIAVTRRTEVVDDPFARSLGRHDRPFTFTCVTWA